jgi:hypothetical protein
MTASRVTSLGGGESVLDDFEDIGKGRQGENAHHHAADAGSRHELVAGVAQVLQEVPIELGLSELLQPNGRVELRFALARQQRA